MTEAGHGKSRFLTGEHTVRCGVSLAQRTKLSTSIHATQDISDACIASSELASSLTFAAKQIHRLISIGLLVMLLPEIDTARLALPSSRSAFDNAPGINIKTRDSLTIGITNAMLPSSCALKAPMRYCAALANAVNSCASDWPAVANAHAMSARFCTLEFPRRHSAALANSANSCASGWLAVANAHAVLANICALELQMRYSAILASVVKSCSSC